jgi:hypothetical protein
MTNHRTFTRQQTDRATAIAIGIMAAVFAIAGIAGYVAGSFDRAATATATTQEPNQ